MQLHLPKSVYTYMIMYTHFDINMNHAYIYITCDVFNPLNHIRWAYRKGLWFNINTNHCNFQVSTTLGLKIQQAITWKKSNQIYVAIWRH